MGVNAELACAISVLQLTVQLRQPMLDSRALAGSVNASVVGVDEFAVLSTVRASRPDSVGSQRS